MDTGTHSWLVTVRVFGSIGWLVASRRRSRTKPTVFVVLLGAAAVGYFVGVSTILFGVDEFRILLNWVIVSVCIGSCLGLVARNRKLGRI